MEAAVGRRDIAVVGSNNIIISYKRYQNYL